MNYYFIHNKIKPWMWVFLNVFDGYSRRGMRKYVSEVSITAVTLQSYKPNMIFFDWARNMLQAIKEPHIVD